MFMNSSLARLAKIKVFAKPGRLGAVRIVPVILMAMLLLSAEAARAGDDASGPIRYSADLSQPFTAYSLTKKDKAWGAALMKRFRYRGRYLFFVKTSLALEVDGKTVHGAIYQAVERPSLFYVVNGDAMLKIGDDNPYSPGVGGFDMWRPKSGNFIVSTDTQGGVAFLSGSKIIRGKVTWKGDESSRFPGK